jgi:hypothetical protein
MKAITVEPLNPGPHDSRTSLIQTSVTGGLVEAIAVGVRHRRRDRRGQMRVGPRVRRASCSGTSLGRVLDPGPGSALKQGGLVVGIVRHPTRAVSQLRG